MDKSTVVLVVCKECVPSKPLFVNGHPRNFCGHSGRGESVEYIPKELADELASEVEIRHAGENNRLSHALAKYRESVG